MEQTKEWTQLRVTVKLEMLETASAIMSMIDNNLMIEDYSDIDLKSVYGDLIDESLLNADKTIASISVFIPYEKSPTDAIAFLKERFKESDIEAKFELIGVNEDDWATAWKAYYKPIRIGEHMVIVPAWEHFDALEDDIVVRMDPGMAFGTGTHETTRLVIELLEKYTKKGDRMLDVGTGSGILAICASKLGAGHCAAYDIDPVAVRVARDNIAESGQNNITCDVSDLLKQVSLEGGQYDLVTANIVADIIIRLAPDIGEYMKNGATLIASGIISERKDEVLEVLLAHNFKLIEILEDNGWCAIVIQK
ncbi:MAG: 50S ribosomal protein L11 methyltransferase [Clostridia bacterium]|nr:50S ribosomal protein L11 methyltransferase [Clostridia bacterium]